MLVLTLLALPTSAVASPIPRIPSRCEHSNAPRLCSIHAHRHAANRLRARMGQHRLRYHYVAEHYPTRRTRLVTYWRHVHTRTRARYRHYQQSPRALGQTLAAARGWTGSEWQDLDTLWTRESGWNPTALNPSSGACGVPQFVPCRDYGDTRQQLVDGLAYIASRYGTPAAALAHSNTNGWY